ncbi:MAG TPA: molybdopterin-binding protein, partial [Thermoleophilia bacterium]|nr:molybdopterin-binding protein [Thermoleophilia bacterium]
MNRPAEARGDAADPTVEVVPDPNVDEAPIVEIVAAGNEVLLGDVLDTNSNWLCRRVTALGGRVRRCALVRDEIEAIADEL